VVSTLFGDLVQSLREAGQIKRGEAEASRRFTMSSLDVKKVRERTGLSQGDFASLMHVSIKTLQNWEQQRRTPTGPASALLKIVSQEPMLAMSALQR